MHGLTNEQISLYAICWLVAFFASVSRSLRDADYLSSVRLFGLGFSAGFLALGAVCVGVHNWLPNSGDNAAAMVGASALIGLIGKEQDKFLKFVVSKSTKIASQVAKVATENQKDDFK